MKNDLARNINIDILRGIAIICMVMGHCITKIPLDMQSTNIGELVAKSIGSFNMPLFFIISGYVYRYTNFKKYYISKIKRIFVPYFIWATIDISIHSLSITDKLSAQGGYDFLPAFIGLFIHGSVLWFLYTLFEIILIYPIIYKRSITFKLLVVFILILVLYFVDIKTPLFSLNNLLKYIIFFIIGDILKCIDKEVLVKGNCIFCSIAISTLLIVSKVLFNNYITDSDTFIMYIINAYIEPLLIIYLIYLMVVISKNHFIKLRNYIAKCGYYSLQIYIFNFYTIMVGRWVLYKYFHLTNMPITFAILLITTLLFSTIFSEKVIEKSNILKFVFGIK